jgi:hypothetical protein
VTEDLLPRFFRVRQRFPRPRLDDVPAAMRAELERVFPAGSLRPGMEIGVTVGSRGIRGIAEMARAAVDFFKERQAQPFILPAMGSHGGAEGEEQRDLIAEYGVTEETMGVPIRYAMETRSLGKTDGGVEVFLARAAWDADGVLLLNRIKPHTDFKGRIESGLSKICAIGLGKLDGAREYHSHIFDIGLGEAILQASGRVLESGKILGGVGILENAYHDTARLGGVTVDGFFDQEAALLDEARGLMGRLPFGQFDVLVCDRMGKNISGAGLDTNIIGRGVYGYVAGQPWMEGMPSITRIAVLDLSDESHGNGTGMGLVDFATERFYDKVDLRVTRINSVTACAPGGAKTPVVLPTDREAIATAVRTTQRRPEGPRVAYIRDTMALEELYLSEALLAETRAASDLEILSEPAPLPFDDAGTLASPFALEVS